MANDSVSKWSAALRDWIPGYVQDQLALRPLWEKSAIVLHGSTTLGIDDGVSDLDLWVFSDDELIQLAERQQGTRFFGFKLLGKDGHFNLESTSHCLARISACDLERIAELRTSVPLFDPTGDAGQLIQRACEPMRREIQQAWFCYHYVEMRSFHRNCDSPMARGDRIALLQGIVPTLTHAMRAAIVLDGECYPYIKWLAHAARLGPTGQIIMPVVDDIIAALGRGALEANLASNPLNDLLKSIRRTLIDRARAFGIDGPWLDRWWEHLEFARHGIAGLKW